MDNEARKYARLMGDFPPSSPLIPTLDQPPGYLESLRVISSEKGHILRNVAASGEEECNACT